MVLAKRAIVRITDVTGDTPLGVWLDAPTLPALRIGAGISPASLTLTLPRRYGALGELNEPGVAASPAFGGDASLQWGARVEIYSAGGPFAPAGDLGRLVWAGTIEDWTPHPPDGVDVALLSVDRLLDQTPIWTSVTATGDTAATAHTLVTNWSLALTWDPANPATSGQSANVTFGNQTLRSALESLRDLSGVNWLLAVTPQRTIRFFKPDLTVATHTLVAGVHCTEVKLAKIGNSRKKWIVVPYNPGVAGIYNSQSRSADNWWTTDPRAEIVTVAGVGSAADAQTISDALLAAKDQITLRGEVRVLGDRYDIDTIQVGDTVRLLTPSLLPASGPTGLSSPPAVGAGGVVDYAGENLVIVAIDYEFTSARLELSEPQPRQYDQLLAWQSALAIHLGAS